MKNAEPVKDWSVYQKIVVDYKNPNLEPLESIAGASLGLQGEWGEVVDLVKKILYNRRPLDPAVSRRLEEELGDVFFYLTVLAYEMGTSMGQVASFVAQGCMNEVELKTHPGGPLYDVVYMQTLVGRYGGKLFRDAAQGMNPEMFAHARWLHYQEIAGGIKAVADLCEAAYHLYYPTHFKQLHKTEGGKRVERFHREAFHGLAGVMSSACFTVVLWNLELPQVLGANIDKVKTRYPDGFKEMDEKNEV